MRKAAQTAGEHLAEARHNRTTKKQAKQALKGKENKKRDKPRGQIKDGPVRAIKATPADEFTDEDFEEVDEDFDFEDDDN